MEPLSEDEFITKYGRPPWDFLNDIFAAAELDFRINAPYPWDDRPYEAVLRDENRGIEIKFVDLSSGERILMSFALCLYHASDSSSADFPKVILFDEIDAPLHPSMTRSLLRTIGSVLVEQHHIAVILTTHSPSTIALASDESIHVMNKFGARRLQKTTKDAALGILTSGVATLSVSYENRRQVFVESKYDVDYYSSLYILLKSYLLADISLAFIAIGIHGNSNCGQVKSVVASLREGGNKTVLGGIDWDGTNVDLDGILVLGGGERYSVDNYILDPVLVGFFLIREKIRTAEVFGLSQSIKYSDLPRLDGASLQALVDSIVAKVADVHRATNEKSAIAFEYCNGRRVTVPQWFAHLNGHALEGYLKDIFPELHAFRNEPDLKRAIIKKIVDDLPGFAPFGIVSFFRRLQALVA